MSPEAGPSMRIPSMLESEQRERQSRLTAVLADAAIATPAALDAVLATLYRPRPDRLAHVSRVARLAAQMGRDLNLTERAIEDLERASLVHELGRVAIPDPAVGTNVLNVDLYQPTEQIFACAAIVSTVPFLGRAADIVLASRECIDGTGLPFGLKDSAISLEARILHVADVFDTVSVVSSNFAVHPDTANVELLRYAGSKFDSDVVAACLRCTEMSRPPAAFRTAWRPA